MLGDNTRTVGNGDPWTSPVMTCRGADKLLLPKGGKRGGEMTGEEFEIHGTAWEDGYIFFTSPDMPGFRLLLEAREDVSAYREDLLSAIHAFYPLHKSAEARRRLDHIVMASQPSVRNPNSKSLDFLASFATGAA